MTDTENLRRKAIAMPPRYNLDGYDAALKADYIGHLVRWEDYKALRMELIRVTAERDAARAGEDELAGALIWCSGSEDFSDGGKAVIGWLKLARPAIEAYLASRPNHGKGCVHTEPCECGEPK